MAYDSSGIRVCDGRGSVVTNGRHGAGAEAEQPLIWASVEAQAGSRE